MHITNILSTLFGYFARYRFPSFVQRQVNRFYANMFHIDFTDFAPLESYDSLNALFTRKFTQPKKIDDSKTSIISPCDALITETGHIQDCTALQIKGRSYKLKTFLSIYSEYGKGLFSEFENGHFINFYLSPKDYHCYHAPCDLEVVNSIHIGGRLFPVNLKFLNKKEELFNENERVILECRSAGKIFYLVFVGALNVGGMKFVFDEKISTNKNANFAERLYDNIHLKKGDMIGNFEMGSTVIMITPKDFLTPTVNANDNVRFADIIAHTK